MVSTTGTVQGEAFSKDWSVKDKSFRTRKSVRGIMVYTGIKVICCVIFIENKPSVDTPNMLCNINLFSKDEDLRKFGNGIG